MRKTVRTESIQASPRGFAPKPRTRTKRSPNDPKVTLWGDTPRGTWFLQAEAGKVVWVHGFAAETRVFDTEGAEGPNGGGVGGEVNLPP